MLFVRSGHILDRAHDFFKASPHIVGHFVGASGYVLGQEAEVFHGLEHASRHEVVVRETGFGAAEARVVRTGLGRGAVP